MYIGVLDLVLASRSGQICQVLQRLQYSTYQLAHPPADFTLSNKGIFNCDICNKPQFENCQERIATEIRHKPCYKYLTTKLI